MKSLFKLKNLKTKKKMSNILTNKEVRSSVDFIVKIIDSCETKEHFISAKNLIKNFKKQVDRQLPFPSVHARCEVWLTYLTGYIIASENRAIQFNNQLTLNN